MVYSTGTLHSKQFWSSSCFKYLAKKTTKIIAISNIQKKELCQDFKIAPEDKFEVIPLGFDLHKFQENTTSKRKQFRDKYNVDEHERQEVQLWIETSEVQVDHKWELGFCSLEFQSHLCTLLLLQPVSLLRWQRHKRR